MKEAKTSFCRGLEFYYSSEMGLCGVENDRDGNQHTYQYLTAREAVEWIEAWTNDRAWTREPRFERSHA